MKKKILRNTVAVFASAIILASGSAVVNASDLTTVNESVEGVASDSTFDNSRLSVTEGEVTIGDEVGIKVNLDQQYTKVTATLEHTLGEAVSTTTVDLAYDAATGEYSWSQVLDGTTYNGSYKFTSLKVVDASNVESDILLVTASYTVVDARTTEMDQFVSRLYTYVLEREAEAAEITAWAKVLADKSNAGSEVAYGFFFSPELVEKNVADEAYVELLYNAIFGRVSDEEGKAAWLKTLANGVSRLHVFKGFADSQEWSDLCATYGINQGTVEVTEARDVNSRTTAFIYRLYTVALDREAEVAGLNAWVTVLLEKKETPQQVAAGFIFSQEFSEKEHNNIDYVKTLYRTFMGREADSQGLAAWTAQLDNGIGRDEVFEGFAQSPEFAEIIASFGL